ncbi:MAG: flavin reductase [Lautropia sp.]
MRSALAAKRTPMGSNEIAVLESLTRRSAMSLASIAAALSVTRAVAQQIVRRLVAAGYVEPVETGSDRRAKNWAISAAGVSFLGELHQELDRLSTSGPVSPSLQDADRLAPGLVDLSAALFAEPEIEPSRLTAVSRTTVGWIGRIWLPASRIYRFARAEQTRFLLDQSDNQIDSAAYMTLYRIYERPASMSDVATFLGIDVNTATRLIERLERHDYLTRTPTAGNRRELTIQPTDKAVRLLRSLAPLDPIGRYVRAVTEVRESATRLNAALGRNQPSGQDFDSECFVHLLRDVVHLDPTPADRGARERFSAAMARFVTGVAVLTVADGERIRCETVNSVTSASLDPPTLLICLDSRSKCLGLLEKERVFGLSFLCAHQIDIARRFERRDAAADGHSLTASAQESLAGAVVVRDAAVQITCRLVRGIDVGSHRIVLAQPDGIAIDARERAPLMFWGSRFLDGSDPAIPGEFGPGTAESV